MDDLYAKALNWIIEHSKGEYGSVASLYRQAGASKLQWYRVLNGKDILSKSMLTWLSNLGFALLTPEEAKKVMADLEENKALREEIEELKNSLLDAQEDLLDTHKQLIHQLQGGVTEGQSLRPSSRRSISTQGEAPTK